MTYLIKRGKRARLGYAKAHIEVYDRLGRETGVALCGRSDFNLSSNVPWGLGRCKDCLRALERID